MIRNLVKAGALLVILSAGLGGCASAPSLPSTPVEMSRCRLGSHTEAYFNYYKHWPRRHGYYFCLSDTAGFLRHPGDERTRMRPF
jgi:hypothetical protein